MGTNYYVGNKACKECGHRPDQIHLGKASAGWQFSFQYNGGKFYKNVPEMKEWLKDKQIVNEYGDKISQWEFWEMVDTLQNPTKGYKNHAEYCHKEYPSMTTEHIIDGYSFSDVDFS